MLQKFRALPLHEIKKAELQLKHRVKKDFILTGRDVVGLFLVKAKQNGRLGEEITVVNSLGKKLKAIVTAINSAEIK